MDTTGTFKGKPISGMSREELLEFAVWAGSEISRLKEIERDTQDFRIEKEIGPRPKRRSLLALLCPLTHP